MITHTTLDLDAELLAAAQQVLGTAQPAETIQRALQAVVEFHKRKRPAGHDGSEGTPASLEERRRPALPEPVIDESAQPLLTRTARSLLDRLLPEMARIAREHDMDVTRVEVSGFFFYDGGSSELVVTQFVDAEPETALDYWEALIEALADWSRTLPKARAKFFDDRTSIQVEWEEDDATTAAV